MKRIRRAIALFLVLGVFTFPLKGCAAGPGAGLDPLARLALGVGASVGTYFLIKELD